MRGDQDAQDDVWSYIPLEQRVPAEHPLRPLRAMVDAEKHALAAGKKADAAAALKDAQPIIDSLVNKNVIHRNKAARHKSALVARIKAL